MVVASPPPPILLSAVFGLILISLLKIFVSSLVLDSVFAQISFASHVNEVWELALVAELMKSGNKKIKKGRVEE